MKKKLVILSIGMLPLVATYAQQDTTLVRTVVVENQYNPIVMDASKINVLPKVEEPTVPKTHIDYATSVRPVSAWNYRAMSPIVKEWKADAAHRGHLRAGYGYNGNVDAALGYLWDISKKDRLNVAASLDGWNGELIDLNDMDWTSRLYNSRIVLDYKHVFKKMDLMMGGYYRSQVFNYMNALLYDFGNLSRSSDQVVRRQHQTMGNAYLGLASTDEDLSIQYSGEMGLNYFKQKYPTNITEGNEMNLYVKGDVQKLFKGQTLGVLFDFNNYSYSIVDMENATSLELNPYFLYGNDDWRIRLGAHVDWWIGTEDKVNLSPDVNVEYVFADSYVLYAKAGGGRENKSLMELTEFTPYWGLNWWSKPHNILPTYVSLDAALGLKASPANGWWFNLTGGYQVRENDLYWELVDGRNGSEVGFTQGKSKVAYGSAELKSDYKDLFDLSLKATYYAWDCEKNEELDQFGQKKMHALKPELELNAEVGFKPMDGLRVNVGYEYVKRSEDMYDPINNLYVGADYILFKNLSVFAQVNNLLNKEYVRHDAYPAQKLNFLAGVSLKF